MISLSKIVKELNIQKKEKYGSGSFHKVYPLKNHPNKVVKISHNKEEWKKSKEQLEIFNQNPSLFPKVYKVTDKYAVIEKLDDKKAYKEDEEILLFLNEKIEDGSININDIKNESIIDQILTSGDIPHILYMNLLYNPSSYNKETKELIDILSPKYANIVKKYVKIINDIYNKFGDGADIHIKQFAYDSNNNIKLIDF